MATSPSEAPPPELVAIAIALEATLLAPGADEPAPRPDVRPWRWDGWDETSDAYSSAVNHRGDRSEGRPL
jgi:hypothetical protein